MSAALLACALLGGCVTPVATNCPRCVVVDRAHPSVTGWRPRTRRLFVLIPGALGYGWEWNAAVDALRRRRDVDFLVFAWDPWQSFQRAADELTEVLAALLWDAPPSVREVVVVAHSAAGIFAAKALGRLRVPEGRHLRLATIGAPFAGMLGPPGSLDDPWHSPVLLGVMGTFRDYPHPPPRTDVVEYVTSYPEDPVMQPRYGHVVAPAEIGPPGRSRISMRHADHNQVVARVVERLLADDPKEPR